jgi:hypothetical protein
MTQYDAKRGRNPGKVAVRTFAIKAEIGDPKATTFTFTRQKTMYGGKHVAKGDVIFLFASENEGGQGLVARGLVTSTRAIAKKPDIARQTPRVSITVKRSAIALRPLGRLELKNLLFGMTAGRRRNLISNSIVRPRTKLLESLIRRQNSWKGILSQLGRFSEILPLGR